MSNTEFFIELNTKQICSVQCSKLIKQFRNNKHFFKDLCNNDVIYLKIAVEDYYILKPAVLLCTFFLKFHLILSVSL